MKTLLRLVVVGGTLFVCTASAKPARPPNVVLIVLDDMNGYATTNRYAPLQMPELDRFRRQSVNFVNAACSVPVCNPSRASFLSGLQPSTNGAYLNGADIWDKPGSLAEKIESLPEFFKSCGYTTWGAGKIFHSRLPPDRLAKMWDIEAKARNGFGPQPDPAHPELAPKVQPWRGPDSDFPDVENADQAIAFLEQEHDQPFFVFYGLWRPHSPYTAPRRFFEQFDPAVFTLPPGWRRDDLADVPAEGRRLTDGLKRFRRDDGTLDEAVWRTTLWGYCAAAAFADWNLGRVLKALDRSSHARNTIVIVTSDNGYQCGEKERWEKATLWEASAHVPLLVCAPGAVAGVSSSRTVSLLDLYPTLVELTGQTAPRHALEGRSFAALLREPEAPWDRPSFTAYGKGNGSVRDERFRYIRYADGSEELYDHVTDPHEFSNLAADPALRPEIDRLARHLPATWAPSWGGRWEVSRPGELARFPPEYPLPAGYSPKSKS